VDCLEKEDTDPQMNLCTFKQVESGWELVPSGVEEIWDLEQLEEEERKEALEHCTIEKK
jgi:hypothetical protein